MLVALQQMCAFDAATRPRFGVAAILAVGFLLSAHAPAWAAAWTQPEGQGLAIFDATMSGGSRYFDKSGKLADVSGFHRTDAYAYVEYGVTDWLMAVIQPDLTAVSLDGIADGRYRGLGTSDIGAQVRLLLYGPAVFSVAATFRAPGSTDRSRPALIGQTSHDADLRGLFGLGFSVGPWPAFLDAQAAYRVRDSGAPDEIHADLTLGVRPWPDLMLLLQGFNTTSVGPGTYWFPHQEYTHVQFAAVYDIDLDWSIELGAFTTVFGYQSLRERGVTTAVWRRF